MIIDVEHDDRSEDVVASLLRAATY